MCTRMLCEPPVPHRCLDVGRLLTVLSLVNKAFNRTILDDKVASPLWRHIAHRDYWSAFDNPAMSTWPSSR